MCHAVEPFPYLDHSLHRLVFFVCWSVPSSCHTIPVLARLLFCWSSSNRLPHPAVVYGSHSKRGHGAHHHRNLLPPFTARIFPLLYIYIHIYDSPAPSVRASGARGRKPLVQRPRSRGTVSLHVVGVLPDVVSSSLASAAWNTVVLTSPRLTRFFDGLVWRWFWSPSLEEIPGQLEASFLIFLTLGSIKQSNTLIYTSIIETPSKKFQRPSGSPFTTSSTF